MTLLDALQSTVQKLDEVHIATSRLDAELLAAHVISKDRSWVLAHPDYELSKEHTILLTKLVEQRKQHKPIAYIIGHQEFYGRKFKVSPDTLTPRPETETMVELLLDQVRHNTSIMAQEELQIVDVGTGSGCIIITTALEIKNIKQKTVHYLGLDISEPALKIATLNARSLEASVEFKQFDLSQDDLVSNITHPTPNVVMLANLPYVPNDFQINLAATHEPEIAIYGGDDGLDHYRTLLASLEHTNVTVLCESLPPQHQNLRDIATRHGFQQIDEVDFIQVFQGDSY